MHTGVFVCVCVFAHCDEPVSSPESSICLCWIVEYFLDVVAVVQLASRDDEPKASAPGLGQNDCQLKLFNQSLTVKKQ